MKTFQVLELVFYIAFLIRGSNQVDNDESRPYEFGFTIEGQQHRHEKKDINGIIEGEFGFITADGVYHVTVYATDENGNFRILSMKNIRLSGPLDQPNGTPSSPTPPSARVGKEIALPSSGNQLPSQSSYQQRPNQNQGTTVQFTLTTASTIGPGCSGCGIVAPTQRPHTLELQFDHKRKPLPGQTPSSPNIQSPPTYGSQSTSDFSAPPSSNVEESSLSGPSQEVTQAQSFGSQPSSGFGGQPAQGFGSQPSSGFGSQPAQGFGSQPSSGFGNQPAQGFGPQSTSISDNQPSLDFVVQPSSEFDNPPPQGNDIQSTSGFGNQQSQISSAQPPVYSSSDTGPYTQGQEIAAAAPEVGSPSGLGSTSSDEKPTLLSDLGPQPVDYDARTGKKIAPPQENKFFSTNLNAPDNILQPPGLEIFSNSPVANRLLNPSASRETDNEVSKRRSNISQATVKDGKILIPGNDPIPIKDKYPGMVDGLPKGITENDILDILYKFNYTLTFHGHYEKGLKNGAKIGGYFVNGRDGVSRIVTYVADEYGYRPKFQIVNLGLDSPDTPKEESEKQFGLKGFEFVWYPVK